MMEASLKVFWLQAAALLVLLAVGWAITPFSAQLLGLGAGFLVSVYCVWLLSRRIQKLVRHAAEKRRLPSLGFVNRAAAVVLGALILYEIEHHMVMWAFATGILGGYFLIVLNMAYYNNKGQE